MIKNTDTVFILGVMAENMKVNGRMANNMAKENIFFSMVQSKQEYGKMESMYCGQKKEKEMLEQEQHSEMEKEYQIEV